MLHRYGTEMKQNLFISVKNKNIIADAGIVLRSLWSLKKRWAGMKK